MIIGGAEDKLRRRTVLQDFVTASGDREARIVVIPTASSIGEEIMAVYDALFRKLGATEVSGVDPASREEAHDEALVKQLDDATGIFMTGEERELLRVSGRGAVTVMDGSRMITNAYEAKRSAPLLASGVVLHVLPAGATYDLTRRELLPGETEVDPEDAAELEEVGKDLRRMARDIAASDASPTVLKRRMARLRKLRSAEQSPLEDPPVSTTENGANR